MLVLSMTNVLEKVQDRETIRIEFYKLRVKYGDPLTGEPLALGEYGKRRFDWKRSELNEYYGNRTGTKENVDKDQTTSIVENTDVELMGKAKEKRRISKERILFA